MMRFILRAVLALALFACAVSVAFAQAVFCTDHDTIVFGDRPVGSSATVVVNVSNCGAEAYRLTDVSAHPATGLGFAIAGTCASGLTLAPRESCTVSVRFSPVSPGQQSGAVWLHNTTSTPDQLVTFYGRGTDASAGAARLVFSPAALDFGTVNVNASSSPLTLELRNAGNVAIVPSALVLNGPAARDYFATGDCGVGIAIAPGGACSLRFTFTPQATGSRLANLNVDAPQLASLAIARLTGAAVTASAPPSVAITEYYHPPSDSYFLTADAAEAAYLDAGNAGPWQRTGRALRGWLPTGSAPAAAVNACRFFGTPGSGPFTHFYTSDAAECDAIRHDPYWLYEGTAFRVLPLADGACPAFADVVQRLFKPAVDITGIRHRYVVGAADVDAMLAQGWWLEGPVFCAPRSP